MNAVIIACRTLENEIFAAMRAENSTYPVRWIEPTLHNVPQKLNQRLQQELDRCTEFDTVLLAMSLCGTSMLGLKTHNFQLVIPRTEDCITLLLGSVERRLQNQYTYFLTEGWLAGERNIWDEYESCMKRYGNKRGERIFRAMFAHYKYLALVDTGAYDTALQEAEIRKIAEHLGLEYRCVEGTLDYLRLLLRGNWSQGHFSLIDPYSEVTNQHCKING